MLHSAQNRHRQIGTKQREEEPVYGKGFCIQDIIQNSWKAPVYGSFIKSRQIQLCRKAPEQKRNQSTRYSLFQKFHRGIPLPIIQQVGAGQHEEHRNRPVKKGFQKAGGDPESPSRLCPENKICMKNDHSEAGCYIRSCHVEFFLICFRMAPPLQEQLTSETFHFRDSSLQGHFTSGTFSFLQISSRILQVLATPAAMQYSIRAVSQFLS